MAELIRTWPDFNLKSTWSGVDDPPAKIIYTTPTTATGNVSFDISAIPQGAILIDATLSASLGSPYTGASIRTVDGTTYYSPRDVLAKIQALNGNYASPVPFVFKFKANGGTGGLGPHESILGVNNLALTIHYIMPASTGSLNLGQVDIGQTIRLQNIVAQDGSYTHRAVWSLLGQGAVPQSLGANPGYTDFTLPSSWYPILSAAVQGQANCRLETYAPDDSLLAYVDYPFTATVSAAIIPTITGLAAAKYSDTVPAVPGAWNKFIRTKSKATISAAVEAGMGSSIKSIRVECAALNFLAYALPCTTDLLNAAGAFTFTVTVTDQRNRVKTLNTAITVDDYYPPTATGVLFSRALAANGAPDPSGTFLRVVATLSGYTLGGLNPITAKAFYRQTGTTPWLPAAGIAITSGVAAWSSTGVLNAAYTYDVKLEVYDAFGTQILYAVVPTAARGWDFQADRAAFGRYAAGPKTFALPDDWDMLHKGQTLDQRFIPRTGGYMSGRLQQLRGTYVAAANRYTNGALEIRENDMVAGAQSDIGYAPQIGFHWAGRVGATLALNSDGAFEFNDISGNNMARIAANGRLYTNGLTCRSYTSAMARHVDGSTDGYDGSLYLNYNVTGPVHCCKSLNVWGDIYAGPSYNQMVYHRGNLQHGTSIPSLPDGFIFLKHA